MPYLIGEQKLFPTAVDIENVLTEEWLEAAIGLVEIVGSMGSNFSLTKEDMLGNIKKIRTKYETDKELFTRFQDLLQDEKDKKEDKNDKSGTVGGLWLKRGLEYCCEVFWEMLKEHEATEKSGEKSDSGAIKTASRIAYERTLKQYHNFATKLLVQAGLLLSPYKETVMTNFSKGEKNKDDEVIEEMKAYEMLLRAYMIVIGQLFQSFGYKDKCLESVHS